MTAVSMSGGMKSVSRYGRHLQELQHVGAQLQDNHVVCHRDLRDHALGDEPDLSVSPGLAVMVLTLYFMSSVADDLDRANGVGGAGRRNRMENRGNEKQGQGSEQPA